MDASCKMQGSIHMFRLVHKYVSRILGTYHLQVRASFILCISRQSELTHAAHELDVGLVTSQSMRSMS